MKLNPIFALIGFIFGVIGALIAYSFSGFGSELITNGSIALISGIVGLVGIWLFDKDYKIACVQYIIGGLGILVGVSAFGILGFAFYLIAAILTFIEKDKSASATIATTNGHFFGDSQDTVPIKKVHSDPKLWIIPAISFIIILLVGVGGQLSYEAEVKEKATSLEVTNISIKSEGYGLYDVGCDITPKTQYDYLEMEVIFYDSGNSIIGKNSLVWNTNNPTENQLIKVSGTATINNQNLKPARAELYFYDSVSTNDPEDAIYIKNVTIN